jgi:hypothetical protein
MELLGRRVPLYPGEAVAEAMRAEARDSARSSAASALSVAGLEPGLLGEISHHAADSEGDDGISKAKDV